MVAVLAERGINTLYEIQARALPDARAGPDVIGRAQTGSGKTLAFGLALLTRLRAAERPRNPGSPRGLVLVPTRELTQQVAAELEPLARVDRLRVTTVFGGAAIGRQIENLHRGVDVVVATLGRLLDLMDRQVDVLTECRSQSSMRPTTWLTSDSCPPSGESSTQRLRTGSA